jgi:hypothetical protein
MLHKLGFVVVVGLIAVSAQAQTTIQKSPDQGPFWQPLDPNTGTYVYSDCFIAPAGVDVFPQSLGTWLLELVPTAPTVRFEIWGDLAGAGPDAGNVLATTGSLSPTPTGLEFISAPCFPARCR